MKRLSEYQDDEALDLLAELIDPVSTIAADKELMKDFQEKFKKGEERIKLVKRLIKDHKHEIRVILAALEGVPFEEYHCNPFTLPKCLLFVLNDPEFVTFFTSSAETDGETISGSATENIGAHEE